MTEAATVQAALDTRWVRVVAHARPADVEGSRAGGDVYAVFDEPEGEGPDRFLGLVTGRQLSRYPGRIFADLIPRPAPPPISHDVSLEAALRVMGSCGWEALPVLDSSTQAFRGVVSQASLLSTYLRREQDAVRESQFLKLILERNNQRLKDTGARVQQLYVATTNLAGLMGRSRSETDLLQAGIRALAALVGAKYGAVGVLDADGRLIHFLHTGISPEAHARIGALPRGRGLLGVVVEEKQVLRLDDMTKHPRFVGFPAHHPPMKSLLAVPIVHGGEAYGRIYLCDKESGEPFTADDEAIVVGFAGTVALAIANAREISRRKESEAALRAKTGQLETVTDALVSFLGTGECQRSCSRLLAAAYEETSSRLAFFAAAEGGGPLRVVAFAGPEIPATEVAWCEGGLLRDPSQDPRSYVIGMDSPPGRVVTTAAPILVNEISEKDREGITEARLPRSRFLGVPIFREKRAIGLLGACDAPRAYTEADQAALQLLAGTLGLLYDTQFRNQRERMLETELLQSQKMEAVGQLAGGIAHDFNNLLTVIGGFGQLTRERLGQDHPMNRNIDEICRAVERASLLTRRLLTFSRRHPTEPRIVDLNSVVAGMQSMLRRLVSEEIEIRVSPAPDLWKVAADPAQLEQAILNICLNARDAMPRGGSLLLQTENVPPGEHLAPTHPGVEAAEYVMLAITDTGEGMAPEVQARIFEPFFTTKPEGRGTGLGLATSYGIVRQTGGHIQVYSEPGHGTTLRVYLPRTADERGLESGRVEESACRGGSETILVVEDDVELREVTRAILESKGYTVVEARDGVEALDAVRSLGERLDLVLTDVIMPRMSGPDLAKRVASVLPRARIVLMSGYTGDALARQELVGAGQDFVQKPFTVEGLTRRIRTALDSDVTARS